MIIYPETALLPTIVMVPFKVPGLAGCSIALTLDAYNAFSHYCQNQLGCVIEILLAEVVDSNSPLIEGLNCINVVAPMRSDTVDSLIGLIVLSKMSMRYELGDSERSKFVTMSEDPVFNSMVDAYDHIVSRSKFNYSMINVTRVALPGRVYYSYGLGLGAENLNETWSYSYQSESGLYLRCNTRAYMAFSNNVGHMYYVDATNRSYIDNHPCNILHFCVRHMYELYVFDHVYKSSTPMSSIESVYYEICTPRGLLNIPLQELKLYTAPGGNISIPVAKNPKACLPSLIIRKLAELFT